MSPEHRDDSHEIDPVEQALSQFAPLAAQVDRDRLMFLAGAASGSGVGGQSSMVADSVAARRGSRMLWPAATAALAATSLALAVALFLRPQPRVEIVYVERPAAAVGEEAPAAAPRKREVLPVPERDRAPAAAVVRQPSSPQPVQAVPRLAGDNYLRTREVALRMGLDALGTPRSSGGGSAGPTYLDWLSGLAEQPAPAQSSGAEPHSKM